MGSMFSLGPQHHLPCPGHDCPCVGRDKPPASLGILLSTPTTRPKKPLMPSSFSRQSGTPRLPQVSSVAASWLLATKDAEPLALGS